MQCIELRNEKLLPQMKELKNFEIISKNIIAIQDPSLSVGQQLNLIQNLEKAKFPEYVNDNLKKCLDKNPDINYFRKNNLEKCEIYAKLNTADIIDSATNTTIKQVLKSKLCKYSRERRRLFIIWLYITPFNKSSIKIAFYCFILNLKIFLINLC